MKSIQLINKSMLVLAGVLIFAIGNDAIAQESMYRATAVVSFAELSDDDEAKIQELCDKSKSLSVDYACVDANVMVFKLHNITYNNKADAQMFITNKLKEILPGRKFDFLHVSVGEISGMSRC